MYVLVKFDLEKDPKGAFNTFVELASAPNGTFLHSLVFAQETVARFGRTLGVWKFDLESLDKYGCYMINQVMSIYRWPGIKSIEILPFDDPYPATIDTPEYKAKYTALQNKIIKYIAESTKPVLPRPSHVRRAPAHKE